MLDMSLVGKQAYTPYSTNIDYMVKHKLFLGKPILAVWNGLVSMNNLREIQIVLLVKFVWHTVNVYFQSLFAIVKSCVDH